MGQIALQRDPMNSVWISLIFYTLGINWYYQMFFVFANWQWKQWMPGSSPSRIQGYPQDDGIGERIAKRRERLDLSWLTQKANKSPGTELALFTEAAGTLSVGWGCRTPPPWWRHRAPSQSGLRSPGKKVKSESPCAPKESSWKKNRERKKEKERKNDTGRPSFGEGGP